MNHQLPAARDEETLAIARDVCDLAAHTHAGMAQLARRAAEFDSAEGWTGEGIRSCAHWLSINAGFGLSTGEALVTVGHALERLPLIAAAFGAGELFDKVRELSRVATPADEPIWLELARQASGSQLSRIARACRRAMEADAPGRDAAQRAHRGLWFSWDEDGMVRIRAVLASEDGMKPFVTAAQTIRKRRDGILAAVRHGINNARHEGLNRRVRLIINRAYGFHSAKAALALVMVTLGPITHVLPHERTAAVGFPT
jgi:hypothetical protein